MISFVVNSLASSAQFKEKIPGIFFCPKVWRGGDPPAKTVRAHQFRPASSLGSLGNISNRSCLLYTSDAADE